MNYSPILSKICFLIIASASCLWSAPLQAQNVVVRSRFDPPVIHLGQTTNYEIIVIGTQDVTQESIRGKLHSVDGLKIDNTPSVSRGINIVQGRQTVLITYAFSVQAEHEGTFTIDPWLVNIKGRNFQVPESQLKVVPRGKEFEESMFLRLDLPKETYYVGESIPSNLKVYIRRDIQARLRAYPEKKGDAFTQSDLREEPLGSQEVVNGQIYRVFNWPLNLTAIKAGEGILSYHLDMAVVMRGKPSRRSPFDSLFDDSFFNRGQYEDTTLFTGDIKLTILDLPKKGKPKNFSGAIGTFALKTHVSTSEVEAGEPITLKMVATGEGNFDRIAAPEFSDADNFKRYPPKSEFTPSDEIGYRGEKSFEYIIIPQSEEVDAIPAVAFNYFDPDSGEYVDLSTKSFPIKVLPASTSSAVSPTAVMAQQTAQTNESEGIKTPATLLPIQLLPGKWVNKISPVYKEPTFLISQLLPVIILSVIAVIRRRQIRLQSDEVFARHVSGSKSVRKWLSKARKAVANNDAPAFFEAAQRALQESVGRHFSSRPETLILLEIDQYLSEHNASDELRMSLRQFFNAADAIKFADGIDETEPLAKWGKNLSKVLNSIEAMG